MASSLPEKAFKGSGFFDSVRADMAKNRGMFAGVDKVRHYACMDACFYRLKIFKKSGDVKFTAAVIDDAPMSARVVANGQWYDTDYCDEPCSNVPWHGEIFVDGVPEEPKPSHRFKDDKWFFGQFVGRSERAFAIGAGYPSQQVAIIRDGLFPLNAIVVGNKTPQLYDLVAQGRSVGRVVYGIHRKSDIVFVLIQEDWSAARGLDVMQLSELLIEMGVDDAVMGDGGSSVTLLVDKEIEVQPRGAKDNTCRVGPMFLLQTLKTDQLDSRLTATSSSTDAKFPAGTVLFGVAAKFSQTNAGIQMEIVTFGAESPQRPAAQVLVDLELPSISILTCAESRLTAASASAFALFAGGAKTMAALRIEGARDSGGRIVGTVTVNTSRGKAVFHADWKLMA